MTNSIIAIKGNHLHHQEMIFECFKYEDLNKDIQYDNLDKAYSYLFDNYLSASQEDTAIWAIWLDNDWTIICDPEMVNIFDDEALSALSLKLRSRVFTCLIQTTSNSFGFTSYDLVKKRQFMSVDRNVTDNEGEPLAEEAGLNINDEIFVDDIFTLARKLGIEFENAGSKTYTVKHLGYNDELKAQYAELKAARMAKSNTSKKTWWKFW